MQQPVGDPLCCVEQCTQCKSRCAPDFRAPIGTHVTGRLSPSLLLTDVSGGFPAPPTGAVGLREERGDRRSEIGYTAAF